jgi:hypothetical protein
VVVDPGWDVVHAGPVGAHVMVLVGDAETMLPRTNPEHQHIV